MSSIAFISKTLNVGACTESSHKPQVGLDNKKSLIIRKEGLDVLLLL